MDLAFTVGPQTFLQVNTPQTPVLYEKRFDAADAYSLGIRFSTFTAASRHHYARCRETRGSARPSARR